SVPVLGQKGQKNLMPIKGMVPMPTDEIQGCPFAPRCPRVMKICSEQLPPLRDVHSGHQAACWLYESSNQ
ncbi:MAG: ABC transporter ATP-binding protein, partial [Planctomycetaceae bacterium]